MNNTSGERFIIEYLEKNRFVDILDSDFIDGFIEATDASFIPQAFGAHKCKEAGRTLSRMFKSRILNRRAMGLPAGDSAMGFPKWVYSYQLNKQ